MFLEIMSEWPDFREHAGMAKLLENVPVWRGFWRSLTIISSKWKKWVSNA